MHNESSFNERIANNANFLPALLVLRLILVFSIFCSLLIQLLFSCVCFNSNKKPYKKILYDWQKQKN